MLLPPSAGAGDQLHVSDQSITDHSCTACSITKGQIHIDPSCKASLSKPWQTRPSIVCP